MLLLCECLNDIILLVELFIKKYFMVLVKNIIFLEFICWVLFNYCWFGNVCQLENVIQWGMILNCDGVIYFDVLGLLENDIVDCSEL